MSQSKKNSKRSYHKFTYVIIQRARYSCQSLIKLELSLLIVEESSNIVFHGILPVGAEELHVDRQAREANSRFSQF